MGAAKKLIDKKALRDLVPINALSAAHIEEITRKAVIEELPGALEVFKRFGIDACCGGEDTISEATARLRIDPSRLMWELRREAESTAGPSGPVSF